ncbi:MAG: hypothetical protein KAR35_03095 [Candidatus Heimdallarchaeota archaeon]|nr:hypothetical protein [Candidatus Heimdallarchaeota archaeon]MCK5048342.1 hypothetical protein [Candidatus Heimdallarchaeota archaeon]
MTKRKIIKVAGLFLLASIAMSSVIAANTNQTTNFLDMLGIELNGEEIPTYDYSNAQMTENEVWTVVLNYPDTISFINENPQAERSLSFINDYWYADLWAERNVSLLWCNVVVDDITQEVVDFYSSEVEMSTDSYDFEFIEPTLTEEEVLNIVLSMTETQEFLALSENIDQFIWYDGWGFWSVDFYNPENQLQYGWVYVEDQTGEVEFFEFVNIETQLTEEDALAIALTNADVLNWTLYHEYEVEIYLTQSFSFTGTDMLDNKTMTVEVSTDVSEETIFWIVQFVETGSSENELDYFDYYYPVEVGVNDATGEIEWVFFEDDYFDPYMVEAEMTEQEILDLALSLTEVQEFLALSDSIEYYAYYDGYGYWFVDFYNPDNYIQYGYLYINDQTQEVEYSYFMMLEPVLTEEEAIAIALTDASVQDWISEAGSYESLAYSMIWYDFDEITGEETESIFWIVCLWSDTSFVDVYIDDLTGEITEVFIYDCDDSDPGVNFPGEL